MARAAARTRWGEVGAPLLSAVSLVALCLGALLGWVLFAAGTGAPGDDSPEAGFSRDMGEHHAQAVDMSLVVLQSTQDPEVATLAYDIAATQANQIGRMQAWLQVWDLPLARSGDRMEWMEHGAMDGHGAHGGATDDTATSSGPGATDDPATAAGASMPGMATDAELDRLRAAEGEEADVLFLQLMITHHLGGVQMAQAAVDTVSHPDVLRLAETMVITQESEVDLMARLLAERGAAPREDLAALGY